MPRRSNLCRFQICGLGDLNVEQLPTNFSHLLEMKFRAHGGLGQCMTKTFQDYLALEKRHRRPIHCDKLPFLPFLQVRQLFHLQRGRIFHKSGFVPRQMSFSPKIKNAFPPRSTQLRKRGWFLRHDTTRHLSPGQTPLTRKKKKTKRWLSLLLPCLPDDDYFVIFI